MTRLDNIDILFRCDGNSDIGSGHIMRCISIADAALASGRSCAFLTASDDFFHVITQHGHMCRVLQSDYRNMESDAEDTRRAIRNLAPKTLFVDSYYVTAGYLSSLRELCHTADITLVYIDDVLAFPYCCDVLVNYNIYGPDKETDYQRIYEDSGMKTPRLLLGPVYAPLRAEFQNLPPRRTERSVRNILVSTGGADAGHVGLHLIREIIRRGKQLSQLQFQFIVGSVNEDAPDIRALAHGVSNITLHSDVKNMSKLMCACDLAVSAAGSTLYELCATQTPAVTYILADNQIPGAEGFERHGVLKNCGDVRTCGGEVLAQRLIGEVTDLAGRFHKRIEISQKQRDMVDGMGALRMIEALR